MFMFEIRFYLVIYNQHCTNPTVCILLWVQEQMCVCVSLI